MNRSLPGCCGFFGSNRISAKNNAATRSAAEQQLVGWPLPASEVERTESIRSRVAALLRAGSRTARSTATKPLILDEIVPTRFLNRLAEILVRRQREGRCGRACGAAVRFETLEDPERVAPVIRVRRDHRGALVIGVAVQG